MPVPVRFFQNQNKKKFLSKSNFKILHDLDIKKLNFRSLKINEYHFAWHLFWYLISSKWSWFQASYWPFNLQKIQMKFLQLWHHQGCVIIFSPFIVETSQSDRWIFLLRTLEKLTTKCAPDRWERRTMNYRHSQCLFASCWICLDGES